MEQIWTQEYEGHKNYFEYTRKMFEESRDALIKLLAKSTGINFKPTVVESGYFMCVDVSGCEDKIPAKYFEKNVNYETDANTQVRQMHFPEDWPKVPLDFALCRYLACEHGVSCMPITNFCLFESEHKTHKFIRIAICKPTELFSDAKLCETFEKL